MTIHVMRIFAAIATLCSLMSCGRNSVNTKNESSPIIEALMTLKGQTNKHAFVIVEDPSSDRYVQFTVKDSKEVIFKFPIRVALLGASQKLLYNIVVTSIPADAESKQSVLMTSNEVGRLQSLLRERRLPFETRIRAGHHGDFKIQGYMESIEGTLPDLMEGQRFVDDVFSKVYLLKPPGAYALQTH